MTPQRRPLDFALLAVGVALLGFAYRPMATWGTRYGSVEYEVEQFLMTPNDQAPVVVVALAAWLAYRRIPRLAALAPARGPLAAIALSFAFGIGTAVWAFHVGAEDLLAFSLIGNATGLVVLRWGLPGLRVMWVPIVFLLFSLPIPAPLLVTTLWNLRIWTAEYTGWILYVLGMPAFVSGDQIVRATQTFEVIEGCSGLRSIETLTMLAILLVDLFGRRGWHAAVIVVSAPLVAFGMNGLRVLTMILNPHSDIVAIHSLQGIAILLSGLLTLYGLDALLARVGSGSSDSEGDAAAAIPLGAMARGTLGAGVVMALVSLATPKADYPASRGVDLDGLIEEAIGETRLQQPPRDEQYMFRGRVRYRSWDRRRYRIGLMGIDVFIATGDRRDRRTSILSPLTQVPGTGWRVRESWSAEIDGRRVLASVVEKGMERRVSYHGYEGYEALWLETLRTLLAIDRSPYGSREPVAVVRVSASTPSLEPKQRERAEAQLQSAYRAIASTLRRRIDRVSDVGAAATGSRTLTSPSLLPYLPLGAWSGVTETSQIEKRRSLPLTPGLQTLPYKSGT